MYHVPTWYECVGLKAKSIIDCKELPVSSTLFTLFIHSYASSKLLGINGTTACFLFPLTLLVSILAPDMSRGPAGWLSCAAVVSLSHILGFDSRYAKQLVFASTVSLQAVPEYTPTEILKCTLGILQNAPIALVIFQLARWLLAPSNTSPWTGPGKVLLIPGLTTHSRLFPEKHSFDYSYLVVGIPVGWEGISGGMVSSYSKTHSWSSLSRKGWYHIDPEDYLDRGNRDLGLRGKLDAYLKSQVRFDDSGHLRSCR